MSDETLIPADTVRAQTEAVLRGWGMPEGNLKTTSNIMVETDLRGVDSHGISMLIMYHRQYLAGQLRLDAVPSVVRESDAAALVDGGAGLGHPASEMAMRLAIKKSDNSGIGCVSVFNSHHFGAAGVYSEMAARANRIGLVVSTSKMINVVPTNGAERVLGTNVMSFATPSARYLPVILDMSTSVVAANKVKIYALAGKDLPGGWVVDAQSRPIVDSRRAYDGLFGGAEGGLTPLGGAGMALGGHKGYGLGLFAQILAGCLSGGSFSPRRDRFGKPGDPDNIGHFFVAIDPGFFRPFEDFLDDVDDVFDTLKAVRPMDPSNPVLLPGEPEWQARERRLKAGIPMSQGLIEAIREIAGKSGAPFLLT